MMNLVRMIHDGLQRYGDCRETGGKRVTRGTRKVWSLPFSLVPPLSPLSRETRIGDCSRHV
jgi:hypothetical protein